MARHSRLFFDHALLPHGWARDVAVDATDGMIMTVIPNASPAGREHVRGIALPGMPNLHSHTFQRAMAGLAERRGPQGDSFWTWRQVMYRFLADLTPEDVEAIAAYAMMEMLEGGFTALAEFHYLHHGLDGRPYDDIAELSLRIVEAARETGIGLTLLPVFYAHGGFGGMPPTEGQRRFICDPDQFGTIVDRAGAAITTLDQGRLGIAPHSLRAVTPGELDDLVSVYPDIPVHIHVAEQMREVEDCIAWSGRRPVEWLLEHSDIGPRWCLIHATHLDADETRRLAQSGAVAGLCPITEANLGDGVFAAPGFLDAGGAFGIGTDSNIEIGAAAELKQLEYSQRLILRGRNIVARAEGQSTGRALYGGALAGGAQALGRGASVIAPGARADIVVLDADHPDLAPLKGDAWLDAYLFVTRRAAISTVIVGAETIVTVGRHRARDAISARYRRAMTRILA